MKILVDAQLPPRLCDWLSAYGVEAIHVAEIGLGAAADTAIVAAARMYAAAVITKDEDFAAIRDNNITIIWLRCGNANNRALRPWIEARWPEIEQRLRNGESLVEVR